ncbi:DUF6882 domain-containing protein [Tenacibaculum maritimum]|uniref:DUF6882 domain-containing protein n=1 Tax=Tenacibaculum maritimum TaxID=107401 RepID=UPI00387707D1
MNIFKKLFGKSEEKNSSKKNNTSHFSKTNKVDFKNFTDLINQNAGFTLEKQLNFNDLTKGLAWNIDLNTATLSFDKYHFPIEVIGSLSFNDYSWMWGWANEKSGIPKNLLQSSLIFKKMGEEKQIKEFTKGHFKAEEGFEHQMGIVASGLLKADAYFCANYKQGTMVLIIKSDLIPKINEHQLDKILTTFPQVIDGIDLNHKESFKNYLIDRNLELNLQSKNKIEGTKNNRTIVAEFDNLDRLVSLNGTI